MCFAFPVCMIRGAFHLGPDLFSMQSLQSQCGLHSAYTARILPVHCRCNQVQAGLAQREGPIQLLLQQKSRMSPTGLVYLAWSRQCLQRSAVTQISWHFEGLRYLVGKSTTTSQACDNYHMTMDQGWHIGSIKLRECSFNIGGGEVWVEIRQNRSPSCQKGW